MAKVVVGVVRMMLVVGMAEALVMPIAVLVAGVAMIGAAGAGAAGAETDASIFVGRPSQPMV